MNDKLSIAEIKSISSIKIIILLNVVLVAPTIFRST